MLQMWPWKMSLLLEGNNNSKFQLLLTLQSSVFPSDRIRLGGESEYLSIGDFPSSHPSILALPAPPFSALPPQEHQRPTPLPVGNRHPLGAHPSTPRGGLGRQRGAGHRLLSPWGGHCPLAKMPSPPASFPEPLAPAPLLAAASPPPSPFKYR